MKIMPKEEAKWKEIVSKEEAKSQMIYNSSLISSGRIFNFSKDNNWELEHSTSREQRPKSWHI